MPVHSSKLEYVSAWSLAPSFARHECSIAAVHEFSRLPGARKFDDGLGRFLTGCIADSDRDTSDSAAAVARIARLPLHGAVVESQVRGISGNIRPSGDDELSGDGLVRVRGEVPNADPN